MGALYRAMVVGMLCLVGTQGACASSYRRCLEPPPERLGQAPEKLSETGLFADIGTDTLAEGVLPFRPRFELWSDGASKRRWIWLPPGASIDSADMDAWQFPQGTRLWKEFSSGGVRVETRLLEKTGPLPEDWLALSYIWSDSGHDAFAAPQGRTDARGTTHDVPPARHCMGCHGGTASRVLGFSAIQLDHEAAPGEVTLDRLAQEGLLTARPEHRLELPGTPLDQRALGYLHANCSHCHNQHRPPSDGPRCYNPRRDFDLSLRTAELGALADTAVFRTAIGRVITPGRPEDSALYKRARGDLSHFQARMPPLGTEVLDPGLLDLLSAWIGGM